MNKVIKDVKCEACFHTNEDVEVSCVAVCEGKVCEECCQILLNTHSIDSEDYHQARERARE